MCRLQTLSIGQVREYENSFSPCSLSLQSLPSSACFTLCVLNVVGGRRVSLKIKLKNLCFSPLVLSLSYRHHHKIISNHPYATTALVCLDVRQGALLIKEEYAGPVTSRVRHAVELVRTLASHVHRLIFTSSIWLCVCRHVLTDILKVSIDSSSYLSQKKHTEETEHKNNIQ